MTQSTEVLAALKRAGNYSKLAMHNEGPRSFKRGQGALIKVVAKFGDTKGISCKKLGRTLGWSHHEVMAVAKKAADNGYVDIVKKDEGKHRISLTKMGKQILKKRMAAEDRAADAVCSYLTDEEKDELVSLCAKVSEACEDMGVDYAEIKKRPHHHKGHRVHRFGHHHCASGSKAKGSTKKCGCK